MNLLTQAAEQALVVLNNTTHTGPAMSRCIFNLKAALDAAKTTAHPVGWQQRFICPIEGPSCWQSCDDNAVRLLQVIIILVIQIYQVRISCKKSA